MSPTDPRVAAKYEKRFPKLDLVTIGDFGGWPKAQAKHVGGGGVFEQIYEAR